MFVASREAMSPIRNLGNVINLPILAMGIGCIEGREIGWARWCISFACPRVDCIVV